MPWDGIMEEEVEEDQEEEQEEEQEEQQEEEQGEEEGVPPANGVEEVVNLVLEMVEMEQDGDPHQPASLLKVVAGVEILMGLSSRLEDLNGKMTALPWVEDLMMVRTFGVRKGKLGAYLVHQVVSTYSSFCHH